MAAPKAPAVASSTKLGGARSRGQAVRAKGSAMTPHRVDEARRAALRADALHALGALRIGCVFCVGNRGTGEEGMVVSKGGGQERTDRLKLKLRSKPTRQQNLSLLRAASLPLPCPIMHAQ